MEGLGHAAAVMGSLHYYVAYLGLAFEREVAFALVGNVALAPVLVRTGTY